MPTALSLSRFFAALLFLAYLSGMALSPARAQGVDDREVEGYVTAVHMPLGFDVDGEHVDVRADTVFGFKKGKVLSTDSPAKGAIQLGAYVWVTGKPDHHDLIARAAQVREGLADPSLRSRCYR